MWKIEKIIKKGEYNYALVPDHPNATKNGYVLHHRIIIENSINRLLENTEIVHHINGNKKDNRIENLQLMSAKDHAKLHASEKLTTMVIFKCPWCNNNFIRTKRNSLTKYKNPDRLFFCDRSCGTNYQFHKNPLENLKQKDIIVKIYKTKV